VTVDICVQHGGREALHHAGLSAAAKTCFSFVNDACLYWSTKVVGNAFNLTSHWWIKGVSSIIF